MKEHELLPGHCKVVTNTGDPGYVAGTVDREHCGAPLAGVLSMVVDFDRARRREIRRHAAYCREHYDSTLRAREDAYHVEWVGEVEPSLAS